MTKDARREQCPCCGMDDRQLAQLLEERQADGGRGGAEVLACCAACQERLAEAAEQWLEERERAGELGQRWVAGYEGLLDRCKALRRTLPEVGRERMRGAMKRLLGDYAMARLDREGITGLEALQEMGPALQLFLGEKQALRVQRMFVEGPEVDARH